MTGKMLCLTMLVSIGSTMILASPLQISNELAKEDGCFIRQINKVVPVGTEVTPIGECIIIKCEGKGLVTSLTCPEVHTRDPNCGFTGLDLSVSYPACCPRFTCN